MKALLILAILFTVGIIFYTFKKDKNLKKLFVSLATFTVIISLAVIGNLTRTVMPIFLAHEILTLIAWGALFMYVFKDKYYWWWFLAPMLTIGLFLILEFLGGSAHELA